MTDVGHADSLAVLMIYPKPALCRTRGLIFTTLSLQHFPNDA